MLPQDFAINKEVPFCIYKMPPFLTEQCILRVVSPNASYVPAVNHYFVTLTAGKTQRPISVRGMNHSSEEQYEIFKTIKIFYGFFLKKDFCQRRKRFLKTDICSSLEFFGGLEK